MPKGLRFLLVAGCTIATLLSLSQPVLGYVETKSSGTVGVHSLTDTTGSPGALCRYKPSPVPNVAQLFRIDVEAPHVKAINGAGTEWVGWRFIVQRIRFGGSTWKRIYRSPLSALTTNSSQNAGFGPLSKDITVPHPYATSGYSYRVIVKLYWYKPDGSTVRGSATERVEWYALSNGANPGPFNGSCPDYDD